MHSLVLFLVVNNQRMNRNYLKKKRINYVE